MQDEQEEFLALAEVVPRLVAELLRRCGEARVRVAGTSMLPAIRPGDVLLLRRLDFDAIQPGDVILREDGDRLFAHRVVRRERCGQELRLVTKGDANTEEDPPVSAADFLGRVERRVLMPGPRHRLPRQSAWMAGIRRIRAGYSAARLNHFGVPRTIRST